MLLAADEYRPERNDEVIQEYWRQRLPLPHDYDVIVVPVDDESNWPGDETDVVNFRVFKPEIGPFPRRLRTFASAALSENATYVLVAGCCDQAGVEA